MLSYLSLGCSAFQSEYSQYPCVSTFSTRLTRLASLRTVLRPARPPSAASLRCRVNGFARPCSDEGQLRGSPCCASFSSPILFSLVVIFAVGFCGMKTFPDAWDPERAFSDNLETKGTWLSAIVTAARTSSIRGCLPAHGQSPSDLEAAERDCRGLSQPDRSLLPEVERNLCHRTTVRAKLRRQS